MSRLAQEVSFDERAAAIEGALKSVASRPTSKVSTQPTSTLEYLMGRFNCTDYHTIVSHYEPIWENVKEPLGSRDFALLAYAYARSDQIAKAFQPALEALNINPLERIAYVALALCYRAKDFNTRARRALQLAQLAGCSNEKWFTDVEAFISFGVETGMLKAHNERILFFFP